MSEETFAEIEYTEQKNERGYMGKCVIAECTSSGDKTEPVWGHGPNSVKRALVMLSQNCSCGSRWHEAADPDDVEDIEEGRPQQQGEDDPFDGW